MCDIVVMQGSHSLGSARAVRIVEGRLEIPPGTGPMAMIWLPVDGKVFAKIPRRTGNRRWLMEALQVRGPKLVDGRWELPRNCLSKLIAAAVDRYGCAAVCRDISKLSRCTKSCLEATGAECECSCLGVHHGSTSEGWYERVGDAVVADLGEFKRSVIMYGSKRSDADLGVYAGQLYQHRYSADLKVRRDWPKASAFMCASCLTERATVWDHCHAHGFVRAPLCNACNTRRWRGWRPEFGRSVPSENLDASYYSFCPQLGRESWRPCSA